MTRFIGTGARPRAAPRGASWTETGDEIAVQVASEDAMDALPEAASLPPATLVFVLPEPARGRGLLSTFSRSSISRSARCNALLLRGYVDIGAETDNTSRLDLVYGHTPS